MALGKVHARLHARLLSGPGWDWCLEIAEGRCTEKVPGNSAIPLPKEYTFCGKHNCYM